MLPPGKENWISIREVDEFKDIFHVKEEVSLGLVGEAKSEPEIKKKAPDKNKCPKCGYENKDDAIYCGMCSEPFKKEEKVKQPEIHREPGVEKPAKAVEPPAIGKKSVKLIPIILMIICIIVGYQLYKRTVPSGSTGSIAAKKSSMEKDFEAEVKQLIESGKDINQATERLGRRDVPLLYWAVEWKWVDSVKMLLENGANPDTIGIKKLGEPVLFEIVESIDSKFDNPYKTRTIAELLIKHGANVNYAVGKLLETPLYEAASHGRVDLCKLFIENGAEVNTIDWIGRTPLHGAAYNGYWECAQVLLENGVQPNIEGKAGQTALSLAEERARAEDLQYMRKIEKNYCPGADYDKTIEVLKQYGAQ